MLIDFHAHAFPRRIAKQALDKLAHNAGGLLPVADGTVEGLCAALERADARAVLLPVATNPRQQQSVNEWAARQRSDRIIPFCSVYPLCESALDELDRAYALGLRGVKLHPEYQGFRVDDLRLWPLYRKIASLKMAVVFHAGLDMAYMPPCNCEPAMLQRALEALDGAQVIAAHWGGLAMGEAALRDLPPAKNLYLDTSYGHGHMSVPLARALVEAHGADHILFGSDSPWSSIEKERRLIEAMELPEASVRSILSENAVRVLSSVGAIE